MELDRRTVDILTERYHFYLGRSEVADGLDLESLSRFLIEGFAFSFFSRDAFEYSSAQARNWMENGVLLEKLDLSSAIFQRIFTWFNRDLKVSNPGSVTLSIILDGIRCMKGDFAHLREILYFVTDLRGREHLTHSDVSGFFFSFSELFIELSTNVLQGEWKYLLSKGTETATLESHKEAIRSILPQLPAVIESECNKLWSILQIRGNDRVTYRSAD